MTRQRFKVQILITLISIATAFSMNSRQGDSLALVDIANTANGVLPWLWGNDKTLDEWDYIGLNSEGRVDSLRLWGEYLGNGLPSSIKNMQHLRYLSLINCSLKSLPEEVSELKNLEMLFLNDNSFETINPSIVKLTKLTDLSLGFNKLVELPNEIGKLVNLKNIVIERNKIKIIPESFGNLINLQGIWASENNITHLPESFGNLVNIKLLWMHDNKISDLPMSITNLAPDDRCTFGGNCLDSLKLEKKLLNWLDSYDYLWRRDQDVSIIQSSSILQDNAPIIRVANKKLYLPQELVEGAVIRIVSVEGKLLKKYSSLGTNLIDLVDFSNGLYLVKIESINNEQYLYRVKLY